MSLTARILAWLLALTLVALPVVGVLNGWFASGSWPLRRLQLAAEFTRVNGEQVRAAVLPHTAPGFFAVDLPAIRRAVAVLPWVAEVEVRKHWPDTLEVRIREHRAVARWGDDRLLSDRGELFAAPSGELPQDLPRLQGPDARVDEVLAMHADAGERLAGTGLRVEATRLEARGSWTLELADGAQLVLGRDDPRGRLARFARTLPVLLASDARPLLRADLRYANGFAVRWREPAAIDSPKPLPNPGT